MEEYTISQIHELFKTGKLSSETLVSKYLRRIDEIDKNGPKLNSIIELNPDALETARDLDISFEKNGLTGLLHGIPILLKDNINTKGKMMTTAGSLALQGSYVNNDAHIVKKLRDAGAIIMGKTNLSEWANFRGQRSTSGWSSRGGRTLNPYVLDRNPCGSSSGSGVAVAANLCVVAIGTETDGSIVCPANMNGIVGIKPTIGLVSRSGIIPIAHSQDTAGPMARKVEDAAIVLQVIAGHDENDEITSTQKGKIFDFSQNLDKNGLQGKKLGVARKYTQFNPKILPAFESSLEVIKANGASLVDPLEINPPDGIGPAEYNVLLYEYKHDLNEYLSKLSPTTNIHSIEELIEFNKTHSKEILPYFGQEHLERALEKGNLESKEYVEVLDLYDEFRKHIIETMNENQLDAIIAPTAGPAWLTDLINGDSSGGGTSFIAAVTGFGSITVPMGYVNGLPIGISFIGRPFSENLLIQLAYGFEHATQIRKPPQFLNTAPI